MNQSPAQAVLSLNSASVQFGKATALRETSVSFEKGRIYALVGPNGSGKSTLLKLLARHLQPTSGAVTLQDRRIASYTDRDFARRVAFMPQFTPPTEGLTVRELAALGRFPWHGTLGRFTSTDAKKVSAALEKCDLTGMADRLVDQLSGGERQRAWFAMFITQEAQCLLLDEPTSALDLSHQESLLMLLQMLCRESGTTAVVILHDINLASRTCDEIIAMRGGEIIAQGAPSAIVQPEILHQIYGMRMDVIANPRSGVPIAYV